MRISDWSSDVCSSDLANAVDPRRRGVGLRPRGDHFGAIRIAYEQRNAERNAEDLIADAAVIDATGTHTNLRSRDAIALGDRNFATSGQGGRFSGLQFPQPLRRQTRTRVWTRQGDGKRDP